MKRKHIVGIICLIVGIVLLTAAVVIAMYTHSKALDVLSVALSGIAGGIIGCGIYILTE
jgi:flagellar basal body-associated protein FliL